MLSPASINETYELDINIMEPLKSMEDESSRIDVSLEETKRISHNIISRKIADTIQ
jgi:hypothetical protein